MSITYNLLSKNTVEDVTEYHWECVNVDDEGVESVEQGTFSSIRGDIPEGDLPALLTVPNGVPRPSVISFERSQSLTN